MIYIACKEDCENKGAPYFLESEDQHFPDCPLCGVQMQEIPEPRGDNLA